MQLWPTTANIIFMEAIVHSPSFVAPVLRKLAVHVARHPSLAFARFLAGKELQTKRRYFQGLGGDV